MLEKTTTNTNNPYVVGLLWDDDNVELLDKKNFVPSSFLSLENKFEDHLIIETLYKDTMQEYIFQGHTSKLSRTGAKRKTPTKIYLSHH